MMQFGEIEGMVECKKILLDLELLFFKVQITKVFDLASCLKKFKSLWYFQNYKAKTFLYLRSRFKQLYEMLKKKYPLLIFNIQPFPRKKSIKIIPPGL